jgi:hypothetical protein
MAPGLLAVGTALMITPNAWTLSHAIYLSGAVAMLIVGCRLARLPFAPGLPDRLGRIGAGLTVTGALALSGQFVIDFAVMQLAGGESDTAGDMFVRLGESLTFSTVFYTVGPALLFIGLSIVGLAVARGPLPAAGWTMTGGSLAMGLARVISERAVEVGALVLITGALWWIARLLDGELASHEAPGGLLPGRRQSVGLTAGTGADETVDGAGSAT